MSTLASFRNAITSKAGRQILTAQKYSPQILFGAGVIGVVATVVLACRATLKLDDILDEHKSETERLTVSSESIVEYTEEMLNRDKLVLLARTSGKIAKLYLPGIAIGLTSIFALTGSHIILGRRNLGALAAYAALDKGFRDYRERVIKDLGKDKDDEFRYGFEEREVAEDTPKGTVIKTIRTAPAHGASVYARFFDEASPAWERNAESNRIFLTVAQEYLNHRLQAKGHLFLNDVYKHLGLEESRAGQVVGWVVGKGRDNYVSFGIFENGMDNERIRAFVNGRERSILLDFNVDGPILDLIPKEY